MTFWLVDLDLMDLYSFYFLSFDVIFLTVAMGTYSYIFIMIKKKRRIHAFDQTTSYQTTQQTSQTNSSISSSRKRKRTLLRHKKQFLSTFLLVITFSIFTVVPNFVYLYYGFVNYDGYELWMGAAFTFSFAFSYVCDFFIYTFSSKPIRRKFKKLVRCNKNG